MARYNTALWQLVFLLPSPRAGFRVTTEYENKLIHQSNSIRILLQILDYLASKKATRPHTNIYGPIHKQLLTTQLNMEGNILLSPKQLKGKGITKFGWGGDFPLHSWFVPNVWESVLSISTSSSCQWRQAKLDHFWSCLKRLNLRDWFGHNSPMKDSGKF